jgi:molybdopterin converting factor subunit 1
MKVLVQFFGPLAEQAGTSRIEVVALGPTVSDVLAAVASAVPSVRLDRTVRVAVNTDYAKAEATIREGDTVSLIPPVGGG